MKVIFSHRPFIIAAVQYRAMVRSRANIFCSGSLVLVLCTMTSLVACSGGDSDSNSSGSRSGRDGRNVSATGGKGAFDIVISGDYRGVGTATVGAASVHISADQVVDENGAVGSLTADGQMTMDSSHFTGSGTVLGKHFSFDGRADAPDATTKRPSKNGQP